MKGTLSELQRQILDLEALERECRNDIARNNSLLLRYATQKAPLLILKAQLMGDDE